MTKEYEIKAKEKCTEPGTDPTITIWAYGKDLAEALKNFRAMMGDLPIISWMVTKFKV